MKPTKSNPTSLSSRPSVQNPGARVTIDLDDLILLKADARGFSFLPRQPVTSLLSGRHASRSAQLLTVGVYGPPAADHEVSTVRDYAGRWIACHRLVSGDTRVTSNP